ncbi:SGNH/GDSL hydrolase family protein [Pedobacter frigoris]|uniref:hypothetical protein n=1 Tax=Pedobacter frigoris TaxID=2571272 RepID=UPI00197CC4F7|nr:hypothetical protein [Pedobacter frigoris]
MLRKHVFYMMVLAVNMGNPYASDFKNMFPALAEKNNMMLIPLLLDKVGGVPSLNQPDGIYPTAAGDKILAETVWVYLQPQLTER